MKIIVITGQTATGKSGYADELAQKENGELVNFDSRQIYKFLDIISGKDLHLIKSKVWLYDIVSPNEYFSAFDYQQRALPVIKKLLQDNKLPILVGGTYFYLANILYDIVNNETPPDWELRNEMETMTVNELQKELNKLNPDLFNSLNESDQKNPRRLMRKIEISHHDQDFEEKPFDYTFALGKKLDISDLEIEFIGFKYRSREREEELINRRVESRLKMGAIEEVESILKRGFTKDDPGMKTIGYQQIIEYLEGNVSKEKAIETWKIREMQYAKRQHTFMKKDPNISWREV